VIAASDPAQVLRVIDEHQEITSSGAPRENYMMFRCQAVNLDTWRTSLDD